MKFRCLPLALVVLALAGLGLASAAAAATINNGSFEVGGGSLSGWTTEARNYEKAPLGGRWEPWTPTNPSAEKPPYQPLEGASEALYEQENAASAVLYQEIPLEAGYTHQLSLWLSYASYNPIRVPVPDTLNVSGTDVIGGTEQENQQVRVDVMKAGTPSFSLNPSDILATIYTTPEGAPEEIGWTHLSADLSAYAGQTVRLRIAAVDNQFFMGVGVDAVSIVSTPIPVPPPAPTCKVPNLKGKKLEAAKKAVVAKSCKLGKVTKKKGVTAKTGKVVGQGTKAGSVVPAGSKVTVKLG